LLQLVVVILTLFITRLNINSLTDVLLTELKVN